MQDRTLDSMFPIVNPSRQHAATDEPSQGTASLPVAPSPRVRNIAESECYLTSINTLRNSILKGKHHSEYYLHWPRVIG